MNNFAGYDNGYELMLNGTFGNVKCTYTEDENGVFHTTVEQYGVYSDYDSVLISNISFECEREQNFE